MSTNRATSRLGLSTSEAARHLGVSLSTVRRWSDAATCAATARPAASAASPSSSSTTFLDVAPSRRAASRDDALAPAAARKLPDLQRALADVAQTSPSGDTSGMSAIRTNAAAAMLGVSPNTLRSWERRFGFPVAAPQRRAATGSSSWPRSRRCARRSRRPTTSRRRSRSPASAASGPSSPVRLRSMLAPLRRGRRRPAARGELAVALGRAHGRGDPAARASARSARAATATSPEYGFGWRWATGWLAAQMRTAPPAHRAEGVLLIDATRAARPRRAARAGARARRSAAPGVRTLVAARRPRPAAHRPRARRADAARGRARRPRRVARHARPARLRRAPHERGRRASTTSAARCPRPGATHRAAPGRAPAGRAREAARRPRDAPRASAASRASG